MAPLVAYTTRWFMALDKSGFAQYYWISQNEGGIMRRYSAIFAILLLAGLCAAQDIGLKQIGIKVGPAIPDSPYKVGFAFGATAELGKLHEVIGLEGTLEYMRVTKEVQEIYTNSHSDISLIVTLKVMPQIASEVVQPYIGGGLGFHYLTDTPDETLQEYDPITHDTRPELHILAGADYEVAEGITALFNFKVNLSDISTYNPYLGVKFDMDM